MSATMMAPTGLETAVRGAADASLQGISNAALMYGGTPGARISNKAEELREKQEAYAVWIVLIVAVVVLAGIAAVTYVAIYCISRGGSYDGGLSVETNGWKVWQYKLTFKCTQ